MHPCPLSGTTELILLLVANLKNNFASMTFLVLGLGLPLIFQFDNLSFAFVDFHLCVTTSGAGHRMHAALFIFPVHNVPGWIAGHISSMYLRRGMGRQTPKRNRSPLNHMLMWFSCTFHSSSLVHNQSSTSMWLICLC